MTGALLVLLLFGAYVPAGFMPAAGTPFLLELCPVAAPLPPTADIDPHMHMHMDASMPMSMAAHRHPPGASHHGGSHDHFDTCPFGSAPGAGPLSQLAVYSSPTPVPVAVVVAPKRLSFDSRTQCAHRPRGPPSRV